MRVDEIEPIDSIEWLESLFLTRIEITRFRLTDQVDQPTESSSTNQTDLDIPDRLRRVHGRVTVLLHVRLPPNPRGCSQCSLNMYTLSKSALSDGASVANSLIISPNFQPLQALQYRLRNRFGPFG